MADGTTRCPGCGLDMPRGAGVYDGYFHASPECWSVFTEVVGAEFQNAPLFGQVHQLTVDAYAVQHAGGPHPDKSVCIHLVGLCLVHERGVPPTAVPRHLQHLARTTSSWPHFTPPAERGRLGVLDVALADSPLEHAELVRAYASEQWGVWSPWHSEVARLADRSLARAESGGG